MQDVLDPMMVACETDVADGMTINIGPDEEFVTINILAQKIAAILNFNLEPIYMTGRPQEVKEANCSADLARNILNYQTKTKLDDGLRELVTWIKNQGTKQFTYHLPLEFITNKTPKTWIDKLI
jgi:UDP-glucose 4-epimerase